VEDALDLILSADGVVDVDGGQTRLPRLHQAHHLPKVLVDVSYRHAVGRRLQGLHRLVRILVAAETAHVHGAWPIHVLEVGPLVLLVCLSVASVHTHRAAEL